MRIALGVEYDGSRFSGWQRQRHASSVQGELEQVLSRIANESIQITCAGRTDAGVHALGQVVHFDTEVVRPDHAWVSGGNTQLPGAISIQWARPIDNEFHARFTATARHYRYLILNRIARPALERHRYCWRHSPLDERLMQQGAGYLLGEHDFSAFRAAECQASHARREVTALRVVREQETIAIDIVANAFLHHMVRNIVGVLIAIGEAAESPQWAQQVLAGGDRRRAGITAPPQGLTLMGVRYPKEYGIAWSGAAVG